jgi:hypothetical protein
MSIPHNSSGVGSSPLRTIFAMYEWRVNSFLDKELKDGTHSAHTHEHDEFEVIEIHGKDVSFKAHYSADPYGNQLLTIQNGCGSEAVLTPNESKEFAKNTHALLENRVASIFEKECGGYDGVLHTHKATKDAKGLEVLQDALVTLTNDFVLFALVELKSMRHMNGSVSHSHVCSVHASRIPRGRQWQLADFKLKFEQFATNSDGRDDEWVIHKFRNDRYERELAWASSSHSKHSHANQLSEDDLLRMIVHKSLGKTGTKELIHRLGELKKLMDSIKPREFTSFWDSHHDALHRVDEHDRFARLDIYARLEDMSMCLVSLPNNKALPSR